ncbi:hypothetical protein J1N35_014959 [Gossypium stocksii]|uniref:Plastocyanin-like domain-containing protein n=1 Tax=Gossypium stocksii TaxID=47602 RepID=A0A9D3VWC1_9ROSI|nr:hypothetical protein J1N35_014959 [Gossypium stocksii]
MTNQKFHRDLPQTPVFAYGASWRTVTVPGLTIEALHGVGTYVTWENHLPSKHILPWDPTIPTAIPATKTGVPTVVHLHGGMHEPANDGNANSWFTAGLKEKGPNWSKPTYRYNNNQQPGNLCATQTRYIAMYEYTSDTGETTHLYINGKPYEALATETPKAGTSEIWNVINLTEDNHPMHIHLAVFTVLDQTELVKAEEFKACMSKMNDAIKCEISK